MWFRSFADYFRRRPARRPIRRRPQPATACRLQLEALEDRTAPSFMARSPGLRTRRVQPHGPRAVVGASAPPDTPTTAARSPRSALRCVPLGLRGVGLVQDGPDQVARPTDDVHH
jgi:hypothetical protein